MVSNDDSPHDGYSGEESSSRQSDDDRTEESTDGEAGLTDGLLSRFQEADSLFRKKELLQVSHVVDDDRIVGREEEIEMLVNQVGPAVGGGQPNHVLLFGKTGTGKSLVTRHVLGKVEHMARNNGISFASVYVDCTQVSTETQVVRYTAKDLNDESQTGFSIATSGLPTGEYYQRLWEVLDALYDVVIVILDEIDKLPPEHGNDILYEISRAGERQKTDCRLSAIGISNKIQYLDNGLDQRTLSSFNPEEFVFDPYNANQLQEILRRRRDAFRDGVVTDGAIKLCAALSAQGHGDARRAIDILRNAGELASQKNAEQVSEKHIRRAVDRAEVDRFRTLLSGMPSQQKTTLYALANLQKSGDRDQYTTNEVYEAYEKFCEQEGKDVRSHWTVRDEYLDELEFLGFTESEKASYGPESPPRLYHSLTEPPDVVIQIIEDDMVFGSDED